MPHERDLKCVPGTQLKLLWIYKTRQESFLYFNQQKHFIQADENKYLRPLLPALAVQKSLMFVNKKTLAIDRTITATAPGFMQAKYRLNDMALHHYTYNVRQLFTVCNVFDVFYGILVHAIESVSSFDNDAFSKDSGDALAFVFYKKLGSIEIGTYIKKTSQFNPQLYVEDYDVELLQSDKQMRREMERASKKMCSIALGIAPAYMPSKIELNDNRNTDIVPADSSETYVNSGSDQYERYLKLTRNVAINGCYCSLPFLQSVRFNVRGRL